LGERKKKKERLSTGGYQTLTPPIVDDLRIVQLWPSCKEQGKWRIYEKREVDRKKKNKKKKKGNEEK